MFLIGFRRTSFVPFKLCYRSFHVQSHLLKSNKKIQKQTSIANRQSTPNVPSAGEWKELKQHFPGEKLQTNKLSDRVPRFPLIKEVVPTLLPRPGVPQVGKDYTFRQVIQILQNKTAPELIYESEPHRLYFLACFCMAVVMTVYGCVLTEYAWFQANKDYRENVKEQNEIVRKREWAILLFKLSGMGAVAFTAAYFFSLFPTRLVRRMWYLPGQIEHIKFTTYPLIPGMPTKVITLPIDKLVRRHKARVWTGKGFYGTADNAMFFFVLKEQGGKNWIIDRKGFFWGDGRVFDFLFGKETLAAAEAGIPYDEQIGIMHREVKKKKKALREEHGIFYKWKLGAKEGKEAIDKIGLYAKEIEKRK